jgi:GDP-L-fucose synthase
MPEAETDDEGALLNRIFDLRDKRVWVAGHTGLVGSALVRRLEREDVRELIVAGSREVDLRDQRATATFVEKTRPEAVFMAAGTVGGIGANAAGQAEFLYDNLMIAANTIDSSRKFGVLKFLMFGSSCIYPRDAPIPIGEEALMTGPLEPTNEGYAVAKIAALQLTKMYRRQYGFDAISVMPTNLYGPNDNFDLGTSHVLPALLRRIHEANKAGEETVEIWGSGKPLREFLHVDDLAEASVLALKTYSGEGHLNVGYGSDISIGDLAKTIAHVVGWLGEFRFNTQFPDGTHRKLLNSDRIRALGWQPNVPLVDGIRSVYQSLDSLSFGASA